MDYRATNIRRCKEESLKKRSVKTKRPPMRGLSIFILVLKAGIQLAPFVTLLVNTWWGWRDSNSQGLPHTALNRARIPIPPHPHKFVLSNTSYFQGAVGVPVFAPLDGVAAGVVAAGVPVFPVAPELAAPSWAGAVAGDAAGEA
jgi:hypothetical protein